ncbi:MAG TPA: GNAT family N-acetyltransferase [Candidatus Acidoferrales bacterium]
MNEKSKREDFAIEEMDAKDWPEVRAIYLEGIATGDATFETSAPEWAAWDSGHVKTCRFAARAGGGVLGWAALSPVSGRCVYTGVAEVSVYVAERARGREVGKALLAALIEASEKNGFWTLTAGIFPENAASVALHERAGFRLIGRRERIGAMNGWWRDTLQFERRSKAVGI